MSEKRKRRASALPLVPGGSSFTAMHLVFEPQLIRVKPSLWCYFLAGLLVLPALCLIAIPVLMFKLLADADLLLLGIAAVIFGVSALFVFFAVRMVLRMHKRCRSFFDLSTRIFYPEGYDLHESGQEKFPVIPFSELDSLQVVGEHCSTGKSSFESYELNVVLGDGRRFNLLDHGNKECFAQEAEKLSGVLSLPLTDAHGQPLSCDSFLSLPGNIRENLLCGIYAFVFFAVFFAIGDGRAWYWTRQSFQWEKTPAVVESAKIRQHCGRRTTYSLNFQFRYRYRGKEYTGNDYNFFDMRRSEYILEDTVRRYPRGKRFFCYVDPRSPERAVVNREIPPVWEIMLHSPWTTCFLIAGIFCLLKAAAQYRLLKKRSSPCR